MKLTTKQEYDNIYPMNDRYKLLHETELKVARLIRLSSALLAWKEGTHPTMTL